ncbi:hypothetical protein PIPA1_38710 [Pelosinus sp. IPA-1]|nr:hypothetical protein [Pelosinus sp. IPA-1]GMB01072.1 hypothetical protein PIPA1_38710 [Pelosinus sp. IPA-1]
MDDMLRRTEIIKAVADILKNKFSYRIYSDEIIEGFKQPCFFFKLIKRTDIQTTNFNDNQLSIIITYFSSPEKNKEIEYMNMIDDLSQLFNIGFRAGKRYLHIKSFSDDRIGEKQDILQITIAIEYLDSTDKKTDEEMGYIPATTLETKTKF